MKKMALTMIFLGFFAIKSFSQIKPDSSTTNIIKINDSTVILQDKAVIPAKQIFFIHYFDGVLLETYDPGETVSYSRISDIIARAKKKALAARANQRCTKVVCPGDTPKTTTCWRCKPATPQ